MKFVHLGKICWLKKVRKQWHLKTPECTWLQEQSFLMNKLLKFRYWLDVAWFLTQHLLELNISLFIYSLFRLLLAQCNLCLLICALHLKCALILTTAAVDMGEKNGLFGDWRQWCMLLHDGSVTKRICNGHDCPLCDVHNALNVGKLQVAWW